MRVAKERSYWLIFMISPFMAMLLAIRNKVITENLVWAFIVFYGLTFVISVDNKDSDINRYISKTQAMYEADLGLNEFLSTLYSVENRTADILQPLLSYFVSQFTYSKKALLSVFALVFGFFYSRNIWLVLSLLKGKLKGLTILFFVALLLVVPIWNINGFRFWTATHIFFYGVMTFFIHSRTKGVLFACASVLVHFSFLLPIGIFLMYWLLGNRLNLFFTFFAITIFFNNIKIAQISQLAERVVPEVFLERADSYTSETAFEKFSQRTTVNKNWYAVLYKKALVWTLTFSLCTLYFLFGKELSKDELLHKILSFTFFFFGVANLLALVPSGIRFSLVACLFAAAACIFILHYYYDKMKTHLLYIITPLLALFIIVSIREGFNSMGIALLFSNPLVAIFVENDVALIDIIKWRF